MLLFDHYGSTAFSGGGPLMGRALIIDDHRLFGGGLATLLGALPEITNAQYVENPSTALLEDPSDVVLVAADFYVPGFPATEWLPKLKKYFSNAILVIVSSSLSRTDRDISEEAGAVAFFEKHQHPERFSEQISRLLAGEVLRPTIPIDPTGRLSPRQLDILIELNRGMTSKSIARHFNLSPETVKTHIARLYKELNVSSREEALQWAHENGIV